MIVEVSVLVCFVGFWVFFFPFVFMCMFFVCVCVCVSACISVALCQTVCICFQSFTQCHIPKVVTLIPQRYTVKKPTGIPVSLDTPQISTPRYDTALKSGNKKKSLLTDMIFVSLFPSLFLLFSPFSLLLACCVFSFFFYFPLPPSFSVPADSPAVGSRHIPQSVSLLIPGPDLKGSLKDESLYTVPDFVK